MSKDALDEQFDVRLLEAEQFGDWVDPREPLIDVPGWGYDLGNGLASMPSRITDRLDGRYWPFFRTEVELQYQRGIAHTIAKSPHAIGAMDSLANYTLGTGFGFEIQPRQGIEPPAGLTSFTQQLVDRILEYNQFSNDLDREIHGRAREDGECFVAIEKGEENLPLMLTVEADQVMEPVDSQELNDWVEDRYGVEISGVPSWSFGIHTDRRLPAIAKGYSVFWEQRGEDFDYFPANRMEHFKRNVPRNVKRGMSDYYPIWGDLHREAKVRKNTAEGAAIQAAIAFIREHAPSITPQGVASMLANTTRTVQRPGSQGGTVQTRRFQSGTILDILNGQKYSAGPMGSERNVNFLLAGSYVLRAIGTRWNMPEFMISGDASNGNFASTLVAESPFVKARESDQEGFMTRFVSLLWKSLRMCYEAGMFNRFGLSWAELRMMLRYKVDAPDVASRDPLQAAQTQDIRIKNKTLSRRTAIIEAGGNPDEEFPEIKKEESEFPDPAATGQSSGGDEKPGGAIANSDNRTQATGDQDVQTVPSQTLNGAQIASAAAIVVAVSTGQLPRDSGLGQLKVLLNLNDDQAEQIMGSVGKGFSASAPPGKEKFGAIRGATQAALESTRSGEEAKAILREAWKDYP